MTDIYNHGRRRDAQCGAVADRTGRRRMPDLRGDLRRGLASAFATTPSWSSRLAE
jgi:hypothetical protein